MSKKKLRNYCVKINSKRSIEAMPCGDAHGFMFFVTPKGDTGWIGTSQWSARINEVSTAVTPQQRIKYKECTGMIKRGALPPWKNEWMDDFLQSQGISRLVWS